MKMKFLLLIALTLFSITSVHSKKCRALTMSGAGALGSYQAAVFVGLVNNLPAEDVSYDVITGVSAGSLNAIGLSGFDPDDSQSASDFIYAMWASIPQYKAFTTWSGGILAGFWKKGLFDLQPGRDWMTEELGNRGIHKKITFSSIDANTGQYVNMDYNPSEVRPDDFIESAFAS